MSYIAKLDILKGNKPPNYNALDSWYFSKGLTADGKEVINSKGTNATIKQSFCAKSDNATGYLTIPSFELTKATSFDLSVDIFDMGAQTAGSSNRQTLWSNGSEYVAITDVVGAVFFILDSADLDYYLTYNFTSGVIYTGANFNIQFTKEAGSNEVSCTISNYDNGNVETKSDIPDNSKDFKTTSFDKFGARNTDRFLRACFNNESVTVNSTLLANRPYQGSIYDVSGNSNDATIVGTVDLYERQDEFHYNIVNGFDKYVDDATGLVYIYVPYVSGFPVVSSVSGYTKVTENPAGGNNIPESSFDFTDSVMDKSNVLIWPPEIRASIYYDVTNPFRWHSSELTIAVLSTILDAYKGIVFIWDDQSDFIKDGDDYQVDGGGNYQIDSSGVLSKSQNLLRYNAVQSEPTLGRIINWIVKKGGK